MGLISGKAVHLAQYLQSVSRQVSTVFAGPFERIDKTERRKLQLRSFEFLLHERFVKSIIIVSDQYGLRGTEGEKRCGNLFKCRRTSNHFISDVVNGGCLRWDRKTRVDELAERAVFNRIKRRKFNDSILIAAYSCCFRIVIDRSKSFGHISSSLTYILHQRRNNCMDSFSMLSILGFWRFLCSDMSAAACFSVFASFLLSLFSLKRQNPS